MHESHAWFILAASQDDIALHPISPPPPQSSPNYPFWAPLGSHMKGNHAQNMISRSDYIWQMRQQRNNWLWSYVSDCQKQLSIIDTDSPDWLRPWHLSPYSPKSTKMNENGGSVMVGRIGIFPIINRSISEHISTYFTINVLPWIVMNLLCMNV